MDDKFERNLLKIEATVYFYLRKTETNINKTKLPKLVI